MKADPGMKLNLPEGFASKLAHPLIGIDGLPCAGKTTLATRLAREHGLEMLQVDEFLLPHEEWAGKKPGFPFPYIRYEAFLQAVIDLAQKGACAYAPFDWKTQRIASVPRQVTTQRPVIVEGISALVPLLTRHYGLKIFVRSDRKSALSVAHERSLGVWSQEWREIFMPSVDMYMLTRPERRADLVVAGRGVRELAAAG